MGSRGFAFLLPSLVGSADSYWSIQRMRFMSFLSALPPQASAPLLLIAADPLTDHTLRTVRLSAPSSLHLFVFKSFCVPSPQMEQSLELDKLPSEHVARYLVISLRPEVTTFFHSKSFRPPVNLRSVPVRPAVNLLE